MPLAIPARLLIITLLASLLPAGLGGCAIGLDPDSRLANKHRVQREMPGILRGPSPPAEGQYYIFTSFRDEPGRYGLFMAFSRDGYNWVSLNNDQPLFIPKVGQAEGMRDPCIARGPDGVYHLVWTWERGSSDGIGYASSRDLITWSPARNLRVMPSDPPVDYCWAPEIFFDRDRGHWLIVWSSHVKGTFEDTASTADANHRMYYTTTSDFQTLGETRLFFDPGYPVIDPAFAVLEGDEKTPRTYVMFFKDERQWPEKKQLRMATAPSIYGPWGDISNSLTRRWVEAPTVIRIDRDWLVYYDSWSRQPPFGAIRSRDLRDWDDVSSLMSFPDGHRHGTVLQIPPDLARNLLAKIGPQLQTQQ